MTGISHGCKDRGCIKHGTTIAYRFDDRGFAYYVAELPGHCGADWGYTPHRDRALLLNDYWTKRFNADCRRVGDNAHTNHTH